MIWEAAGHTLQPTALVHEVIQSRLFNFPFFLLTSSVFARKLNTEWLV
jgi:hypothetical protein